MYCELYLIMRWGRCKISGLLIYNKLIRDKNRIVRIGEVEPNQTIECSVIEEGGHFYEKQPNYIS